MFRFFCNHILMLFLALGTLQAQETLNALLYKGNRKFDNQNYGQAGALFVDAVKKKETDFGAHYNLGNTLYKSKKFEQAIAEYNKAQQFTLDPQEKAAALYNKGNAFMQTADPEQAIASYKNALKLDPDNSAILKNLQIAKKIKSQQQSKASSPKGKGNSDSKNSQNQNNPGNDQQDQQNPKNKTQDNGNLGPENKGKGNEGKTSEPEKKDKESQSKELPKDLQQLIMQRSASQERETARKLQEKKAFSVPQSNEKDW